MKGSEFVWSLPNPTGPERERMLLDAALAGDLVVHWSVVTAGTEEPELLLFVSSDALRWGDVTDSVLTPHKQDPDSHMADTERFVEHHATIEDERDGRCGLLDTVGKTFVLSDTVDAQHCSIYGWTGGATAPVTPGAPQIIQGLYERHVLAYTDYSQLGRLVRRECYLNGQRVDLADVLLGKHGEAAARLVSHTGAVQRVRHPGVPEATETATTSPAPPLPPALSPPPSKWRVLRRGMVGPDVGAWQRYVLSQGLSLDPYGDDEHFGDLTERRTEQYQRRQGIADDGIVGGETRATIPQPGAVEPTVQHGIDVSHHQLPTTLDWDVVADTQQFCIARASYGSKPDATFASHIQGARAAGLTVGAYLFYRQTQPVANQLGAFVRAFDDAGLGNGDVLPVVDLEWNEAYDGPIDRSKHNIEGRSLVERLAEKYGGCMIYLAPGFFQRLGEPEWLLDHPWWIAHYTRKAEPWCPWKEWDIWQYSGRAKVAGYSGTELDVNRARRVPLVGG
jgi:lysozyme